MLIKKRNHPLLGVSCFSYFVVDILGASCFCYFVIDILDVSCFSYFVVDILGFGASTSQGIFFERCIKYQAVAKRCTVKIVFLEILQNPHENTCARISFLVRFLLKEKLNSVQAFIEIEAWLLLNFFNLYLINKVLYILLSDIKEYKCLQMLFYQIDRK